MIGFRLVTGVVLAGVELIDLELLLIELKLRFDEMFLLIF
jgi:hypothetical protein